MTTNKQKSNSTHREDNTHATPLEMQEKHTVLITPQDIICDLKIVMSDFYIATFAENGQTVQIAFHNGQKFDISVKECL